MNPPFPRPRAIATAQLLVALLLSPGCLRDPIADEPDGPTVEPEYYALVLCSLECYRLVECGELAEAEPRRGGDELAARRHPPVTDFRPAAT
jgi:hypothetical protein